jgi:hypothetical protein
MVRPGYASGMSSAATAGPTTPPPGTESRKPLSATVVPAVAGYLRPETKPFIKGDKVVTEVAKGLTNDATQDRIDQIKRDAATAANFQRFLDMSPADQQTYLYCQTPGNACIGPNTSPRRDTVGRDQAPLEPPLFAPSETTNAVGREIVKGLAGAIAPEAYLGGKIGVAVGQTAQDIYNDAKQAEIDQANRNSAAYQKVLSTSPEDAQAEIYCQTHPCVKAATISGSGKVIGTTGDNLLKTKRNLDERVPIRP